MIYTNNFNIPDAIANAVMIDSYVKASDYSATSLIRPVQMKALEDRYADEITADVSDGLWRLLGESVHYVLEKGNKDDIAEARLHLSMPMTGITLSCKPDLYKIEDQAIDDYKVTSVYAFLLGDKPEWEHQLNINRYIYELNEFPVKQLRIHAILRDWTKSKANDPDYPKCPFMTVQVPVWDKAFTHNFIESRIINHENAKGMSDDQLPECSPDERWARPDTWAVIKKGNKKATRVYVTSEEAYNDFGLRPKGQFEVVQRPGANVRCDSYCNASKWCQQYKHLSPEDTRH